MIRGNLFADIPADLPHELLQTLCQREQVNIERILTRGQTTDWYDQPGDEWVALLAGKAKILFEGGDEIELNKGDWLYIPAHGRHRVSWTSPDETCIWLAVHVRQGASTRSSSPETK
jgi:cupin 2 domain-containing protein